MQEASKKQGRDIWRVEASIVFAHLVGDAKAGQFGSFGLLGTLQPCPWKPLHRLWPPSICPCNWPREQSILELGGESPWRGGVCSRLCSLCPLLRSPYGVQYGVAVPFIPSNLLPQGSSSSVAPLCTRLYNYQRSPIMFICSFPFPFSIC